MIRSAFLILFLTVLYEGFALLPESLVVLPGVFRMRDAGLLLIPVLLVLGAGSVFRVFQSYRREALLVSTITALVFLGPLSAQFFFGQPYLTGLMVFRHSLVWVSFFVFAVALRDLDDTVRFLRYFSCFIGIWLVLLVVTKYLPTLGVIQVTQGWYQGSHGMRLGGYRLYFPYGDVPIYLYCYALARWLHGGTTAGRKDFWWVFVLVCFYAVTCTLTRTLITSLLLVSGYALATCQRRLLRWAALGCAGLLVSVQLMGAALGTGGLGFFEESNLGRMALNLDKFEKERGRELQLTMCFDNFLRSPVVGVGNLVTEMDKNYEKHTDLRSYRKYGFFTAGDMGFPRMAAEFGLLGIFWLLWYIRTVYVRSKILIRWRGSDIPPDLAIIGHATRYFLGYVLVSGMTLAHFITPDGITVIALALAVLAVAYRSWAQVAAEPETAAGGLA